MRLIQDQAQRKVPSLGMLAMNGLSTEEMEELANEMVELAQNGHFNARNGSTHRRGNLMDSGLFAELVHRISDRARDHHPEYTLSSDLRLQSRTDEVRERIERSLSVLRRTERATKPQEIFSRRFLGEFDWITRKREAVVSYAVQHQAEFLADLYNPLLLKELNQQNLAVAIGCHVTTICRLIKDLLIEFPDTTVREFAVLVPGAQLSGLKGRYVVGLLSRDSRYFDATQGWKISDEEMTLVLRDEYHLDVQRRTVSNYRQWVDDHLLKRRRAFRDEAETVLEQDEEQESPNA